MKKESADLFTTDEKDFNIPGPSLRLLTRRDSGGMSPVSGNGGVESPSLGSSRHMTFASAISVVRMQSAATDLVSSHNISIKNATSQLL